MQAASERWKQITPSSFPWEQEALDFIRERLHDRDPYQAWANFEFIADDGSINEVDLLVLGPTGLFLVEIKSRPGMVKGDMGTWTWIDEGRTISTDNPLLLANRKAKRLKSLLQRQKAVTKTRTPFVEPLVFLSAPHVNCMREAAARHGVHSRDAEAAEGRPDRPGIAAALTGRAMPPAAPGSWPDPELTTGGHRRSVVDVAVARALSRAIEDAGIR